MTTSALNVCMYTVWESGKFVRIESTPKKSGSLVPLAADSCVDRRNPKMAPTDVTDYFNLEKNVNPVRTMQQFVLSSSLLSFQSYFYCWNIKNF